MKATRYYEVESKIEGKDPEVHLIDATSGPAARSHVSAKFVGEAKLATPKRIAELMGNGVKPEAAKEAG